MPTVKLDSLKSDLTKEREGEWIVLQGLGLGLIAPDLPGVMLKVRSLNYPPWLAAQDAATRRIKKIHGDDYIPEDLTIEVYAPLWAEFLLLGWEGFEVEYSPQEALEALLDLGHRRLRAYVIACAQKCGQREIEYVKDVEKNSERPSAGA